MIAVLMPALTIGLGLGATCSVPTLTPDQIYALAQQAGFGDTSTTMVAIALRESGGCPTAFYGGTAARPEQSYGLWQINVDGAHGGNPQILSALGLSDPSQLFDPATNAAAAAYLWGGKPSNLQIAWRINSPGIYQDGYQANLPAAQQAAQDYSASDPSVADASVSDAPSGDGMSTTGLAVAAGVVGLLAAWVFA